MSDIPVTEQVRKDLLNEHLNLPGAYYTGPGALSDLYTNVLTIACQLREILDHRNDIEAK